MDIKAPRHIGMKRSMRGRVIILPKLIQSSQTFRRIKIHGSEQPILHK